MITDEMRDEIEKAVSDGIRKEMAKYNMISEPRVGKFMSIRYKVYDFEEVKNLVLEAGQPIAITNVPPRRGNEKDVFLIIGNGISSVEVLNPRGKKLNGGRFYVKLNP